MKQESIDFSQMVVQNTSHVYDGELILRDDKLSDSEAFQIGTGIANSKDKDKSQLKFVIFDTLKTDIFENKEPSPTYLDRRDQLLDYKSIIEDYNLTNIDIVPMFYQGTDQKQIWNWLDFAERTDMEGIMINLNTPYEYKRTKNLIKVKRFYTMDLPVVRIDKGTGRNKDRLGKVYVDYKGNEVGVGSGFSDKQRDYYWEHPEEIVGKIIEVKYKEQTKNKEGIESLQFPVFVRIRDDKNEVSYE